MDLSLGLFSSAGVDTGSMLLLKTIATVLNLERLSTVLDVGCGVGTLGLSLAKRCPAAEIYMVDRDQLAVEFTRHNAELNGLNHVQTMSRLMLEGPHKVLYDLILSNFPAKAGEPVLREYLTRSLSLLNTGGTAAIVIVYTLAEHCRELIMEGGGKVVHEDASKQHTVFHYTPARSGVSARHSMPLSTENLLNPYIRHSAEFKIKRTRYNLETVWNISDFDNLSWRLQLIGKLISREPRHGVMVFWSPGQGHLPLMVSRQRGARPSKVILAGRDRLELLISAHNLASGASTIPCVLLPLASPGREGCFGKKASADFLVTDINPVPRSDWVVPMKKAAMDVLKSGGVWAIVGRSINVAALTKNLNGWSTLEDQRTHGWRGMILHRNQG